jgi:hypothetical protein
MKMRESEYRYSAAVMADIEPLPKGHRPNPHPLTKQALAEVRAVQAKLKELKKQERQFRRWGQPLTKILIKRQKLVEQLRCISKQGRRRPSQEHEP